MRWRRGQRLPDDAREGLNLQPGERVLAAARGQDSDWVVATEHALVGPGWRTDWADIAHAQWLDDESVLLVDPVTGSSAAARRVPLQEPGLLPETVHERVMASIVVTRRVPVAGGWVSVVGRRAAGGDLVWQRVPDARVDAADPRVTKIVDAAVAELRAELGRV